jgi:hypothetical protein
MDSAVQKVFNALKSGEELTAKQITSRFKLTNPRDAVYKLRREGYPVNLVRRGKQTRKYVLNNTELADSTYMVGSR